MAVPDRVRATMTRLGLEGVNKPKRTPSHPTKSHVVMASDGGRYQLIRFGQQGVSGSPARKGETQAAKARRASFKARHAKNIAKGKMSAAYWADKAKW
jgi:hypothetical protein